MKFRLLVALFAACTLVTGCEDKKDGDDDKKEEDGDKKKDKKKKKGKDDDGGGKSELPKECKDYFAALDKCMEKAGPAAEGMKAGKKAMEDSYAALKDMKGDAAKTSLDALKKSCGDAAKAMESNPACK